MVQVVIETIPALMRGIRQLRPIPAGTSAPASDTPILTFFLATFFVKSSQAFLNDPALNENIELSMTWSTVIPLLTGLGLSFAWRLRQVLFFLPHLIV
jgi:hypothetical protein